MPRKKIKPGTPHPTIKGKVRDYHGRWVNKATYDKQRALTRSSRDLPNPSHTNRKLTRPKQGAERNYQGKRQVFKGNKWVDKKGGALVKRPSSAITKSPGGKLTKTQSKSITKSSGGKLTTRNNKIKPSTTANTSRDTVRGSGTRTGQPGPNRKLISASKPKPKPKPTLRSRLSSAWRNYQNQKWLDSRTTSGATKRAMRHRKIGAGSFRGGLAESAIYAGASYLLSPAAIWASKQLAKGLVPVGRKIDDLVPGINSADERRRLYIADPNKAPGAIEDFDQLTPAQMAEVQAGLSSGTTSPNVPPLTHAQMRAELERDFPLPTKSTNIVKKKEVKKKKKTAKELWINKTRNSPAALSGAFTDDERWALQQKHQAWRKRTGRA